MHCPECGQEILAGSEFCGNCGAPVTRQQAGPVCANCGSPNQPGAEFCAECGARLGGDVMPMQSFCPECGAAVKEGAAFCKECGADLNATTAPAPFVCPECGEPLDPDAAFCGNCGRVLQQGAEYFSVAPEAQTAMEYQPSYPPESQDYSPQQGWVQPQTQDWECSQQQAQYPPQGQQQGWTQQQPQGRDSVQSQQKGRKILTLLQESRKMLMAAAAAVVLLVIGITGFWKPGYLLDLFRPTAKLENGMLALNDITLDFKQTNLSNGAAAMTTVKDKEEEIHNGLIGDLYVMKIDKSCQGKVTVSVPVPKDFKPTTGNGLYIKLGVGRDYPLADGKTARFYEYFDTTVKDGKAVAIIDPAASGRSRHKSKTEVKPPEDKAPDLGEFTEYVGFFYKEGLIWYGEGYQNSKGHFRLWYPYGLNRWKNVYMGGDEAQNLLNDLEEAYNYYKTHGYADHVDTFTPIDVYVSSSEDDGGWNFLSGNMELSERKMFGDNLKLGYEGERRKYTKTTIYHEVFHAVQQSIVNMVASTIKRTLWFDEATATHFEKVITPSGITPNGLENFSLLWQGPIPKRNTQEEGYGRALMIDYMSSKLGNDAWIRACYENWGLDCWKLKSYMRSIAGTEADFVANFYMEVIKNYGRKDKPVEGYFYKFCRKPSPAFGEDRFLSAIKLQLDDKTKEKIANGEEDALPIVFSSKPLALEGYGGYVVALEVPEKRINTDTTVNVADDFPEKCQLKLEAEGGCRIQLIKFQRGNTDNIVSSNSTVIKNFKEQTKDNYSYLVLVTSTQNKKQNIVLKATLEKEDLKEGIYHGKATMTQGKKTETRNNVLGFRLSKLNDGRWGLNSCDKNGNYPGEVYNIPLTYDAKQQLWKGHRKLKENVSKNPNQPKIETATLDCTMKVNLEGKEPVLIISYKVEGTSWKWGFPTKEKYDIKFEGKWVSELKGRNLHAGKEDKVIILE